MKKKKLKVKGKLKRKMLRPVYTVKGVKRPYAYGGNMENYEDPNKIDESANAVEGTLSGASTGSQIGSSFGPWGTVIGAAGGAVIGGAMSGGKTAKQKAANTMARQAEMDRREDISKTILSSYPSQGVEGVKSLYHWGGNMLNRGQTDYRGNPINTQAMSSYYSRTNPVGLSRPGQVGFNGYNTYSPQAQINNFDTDAMHLASMQKASKDYRAARPKGGVNTPTAKPIAEPTRDFTYGVGGEPVQKENVIDPIEQFGYAMGGKMRHAMGGKMRYADGGQMQPQGQPQGPVNPAQYETLASDVQQANGPTHEQGGIPAGGQNEVENDEVLAQDGQGGQNVYSNRLEISKGVSFAKRAEEIGKKKGKYEEDLNSTSVFIKGTARRNIQKYEEELKMLYMEQEDMKRRLGIVNPEDAQAQQQAQQQQVPSEMQQMSNERATGAAMESAPQNPAAMAGMGGGQFAMGGKIGKGIAGALEKGLGALQQAKQSGQFAMGGKMRYYGGGNIGMGPGDPKKKLTLTGSAEGGFMDQTGKLYTADEVAGLQNQNTLVETSDAGYGLKGAQPDMSKGNWAKKGNGKFGKQAAGALGKLVPFMDNAVNAAITANRPNIPAPVMDKALPMKTEFNINPQLAAIDSSEANTARMLKQNSAGNSAGYRNALIASRAGLVGQRNQLYGQKENTETQLKNANLMNVQGITNQNVAKSNAFNMQNMQLQRKTQNEISANVAEGGEDVGMQRREENLKKRDQLELQLLSKQYKDSGVWDRNLAQAFEDYASGKKTYEEFKAIQNTYARK